MSQEGQQGGPAHAEQELPEAPLPPAPGEPHAAHDLDFEFSEDLSEVFEDEVEVEDMEVEDWDEEEVSNSSNSCSAVNVHALQGDTRSSNLRLLDLRTNLKIT